MGLKILSATARGGKTEWAVAQSKKLADGLLQSPYVLLPSRTQVDDFKKRLAKHGGTMGVYLGTFDDISREILDRSEYHLIAISETGQLRLMRMILGALKLPFYQKIKFKSGFAETILAIIRELEAGIISPDSFMDAVKDLDEDNRLSELALVYRSYQNQLIKNGWVDPARQVWQAADFLVDQPDKCPEWDSLIIDGFDDLSPVQMKLVQSLAEIIPDVTVTITGASEGDIRPLVHKRFNRLKAELEGNGQIDLVQLGNNNHKTEIGLFEKLENTLFSNTNIEPLNAGEKIKMIAVPDREGEVRSAFRWLRVLISEGVIESGQAAVLMRNLEPYRKIIDKIAGEYQMPVFIKGGLPLSENPAVAAIISLLEMAGSGPEGLLWHDVISIWQSPYFDWGVLAEETHQEYQRSQHLNDTKRLSDIARWGSVIQGYSQWKEVFDRLIGLTDGKSNQSSQRSAPAHILTGSNAEHLWKKFNAFVDLIKTPDDGLAVEDYLSWVENLLGDLNLDQERVRGLNLYEMAQKGGTELFQRDCQAIRTMIDLFRDYIKSDSMFGSENSSFNSVLEDLKSEIDRQSYQGFRDNKDRIICADCTEVRGIAFNAVALLGLAEGEFPGTIKEDPFLRDEDRAVLREKYEIPLRSSTESAEAEFFYEAILRATDFLLLTRPRIADNLAPWQPSPYWEEILRAVDIVPLMRTSRSVPSIEATGSLSELFEAIAASEQVMQDDLINKARILYPEYSCHLTIAEKVINLRMEIPGTSDMRYDGNLEHMGAELRSRFPADYVWSSSRLENYQSCPHRFFVNNLLGFDKLEPPQEGLDARQLGNIYHHIMEDLYLEAGDDYDILSLLDRVDGISRKVFKEAPRKEGFRETAWWHHTQREILTNVKHSLIVLEGIDESYRFFRAEQKFGIRNDSAPRLDIEVPGGGNYHLRGLIDRVDIDQQGNLRIIDYKTSSPFGFDIQSVREGKKLQLPLYALAAQDGLQLGNVKEGFYFHVRSSQPSNFRMSSFWNDGDRGPQAAINNAIMKGWEAITSIQKGLFSPDPPGNGCPVYCPAIDFCWHYKRQIW